MSRPIQTGRWTKLLQMLEVTNEAAEATLKICLPCDDDDDDDWQPQPWHVGCQRLDEIRGSPPPC